jgi:peptide/nickel transport system substrate-binding protein
MAAESLLRVRLNSDILGTDPAGRREENTDAVLLQIVEGLVAAKEDGTVAPMLASGWTVSDDGRVYTFTLRQGVRFHNGAALTSADVVWSLNRYLGPASRWRCKTEFGEGGIARIVSIAAPDTGTVTVVLDRPAPLFLTTLARTDCMGTGIIQRESVGPDGAWIKPIGTGPFIYDNWRRNQFVELTRFADYAALPGPIDGNAGDKQPLVDRVRFMIIPDGSAARAALLRGLLDILDALAPSELAGVRGRPGGEISLSPNMDVYAVLFQVNDPAVADPRLRRAIAQTIDRVGLTRAVTWGVGKPNASPLSAISPFHGPIEAVLGAPDIAEAKRLAAEAGYHGQPIHLIANRRFPQMFDAAVLVQAMAAEAGIDLVIDTLDWASQFDAYSSGEITDDFSLYANATYLDAKQDSGAPTIVTVSKGVTTVSATAVGKHIEATPALSFSVSGEYRFTDWLPGVQHDRRRLLHRQAGDQRPEPGLRARLYDLRRRRRLSHRAVRSYDDIPDQRRQYLQHPLLGLDRRPGTRRRPSGLGEVLGVDEVLRRVWGEAETLRPFSFRAAAYQSAAAGPPPPMARLVSQTSGRTAKQSQPDIQKKSIEDSI